MHLSVLGFNATLGSAVVAISLSGSSWHPAIPPTKTTQSSAAELSLYEEGRRLYLASEYVAARQAFHSAALQAERDGASRQAAMDWNNAGGSALARRDFRGAMADFRRARDTAQAAGQLVPLAVTMNNLASLYLQMGNPEAAIQIAREALAGPVGSVDPAIRPKLQFQLASGLAELHRFAEAKPFYREAIDSLEEQGDLDATTRILASLGNEALKANRLDEAEVALTEALRLVRIHSVNAAPSVLRGLALVKIRRGDFRSAESLFESAIIAPQNLAPQWVVYADRGDFRLGRGDLRGALADFRAARRIANLMRADIVPADQDRISLEGGLSRVAAGLVEAGNRLAQQTKDRVLLQETFEAAEQDRLWSLRALIPAPDDWRTSLPDSYWDLLARYQTIARTTLAHSSPALERKASALRLALQQIEADAANNHTNSTPINAESALAHVRRVLDPGDVLLSFHVTKSSGWLWVVDRRGVDVYPIPALEPLKSAVEAFAHATRTGDPHAVELGSRLYKDLFAAVPAVYLSHARWLLELDGPLFDLPFAALVVGTVDSGKRKNEPIYLVERAALQDIPGALMLEPRTAAGDGGFLGIGDPIYNAADPRYRGNSKNQDVTLPRLNATAEELEACSRVWRPAKTRVLTGDNATFASVETALRSHPSIIHFATHIVAAPGDFSSGLIALSLDQSGAMGLMGPAGIVAHPVAASLVVLNGCHSGQGATLPGTGLMGLTRAWIGAGARAVVATRWDIPDDSGQTVMIEFYRALKTHPERGPAFALQQAQLTISSKSDDFRNTGAILGAYFVLGRD